MGERCVREGGVCGREVCEGGRYVRKEVCEGERCAWEEVCVGGGVLGRMRDQGNARRR